MDKKNSLFKFEVNSLGRLCSERLLLSRDTPKSPTTDDEWSCISLTTEGRFATKCSAASIWLHFN